MRIVTSVLCVLLALTALTKAPAVSSAQQPQAVEPQLLSAFFGLDNALPFVANRLCLGAWGSDGMPVVLSHTIDPASLQAEDFEVSRKSGVSTSPTCVTLRPAQDVGELRTVLMIGEFGNAGDDPPVKVSVVGELNSDGVSGEQVNFLGAEVLVTPLAEGPSLVWAQIVPRDIWTQPGRGTSCPVDTTQVVRVTWAGGVKLPDRGEPGDVERGLYRVTVTHPDGLKESVAPASLADLGDNDNNHYLCLDTPLTATEVQFPGGHLVDPNMDLNPDSKVTVQTH